MSLFILLAALAAFFRVLRVVVTFASEAATKFNVVRAQNILIKRMEADPSTTIALALAVAAIMEVLKK